MWSGVWQGMGYSSIIYISALSGVDPALHEAAIMDGATKVQRILHIDLPGIKSTIIMLLILQMGSLMNVGFEKVFLLQNDLNMSASDPGFHSTPSSGAPSQPACRKSDS